MKLSLLNRPQRNLLGHGGHHGRGGVAKVVVRGAGMDDDANIIIVSALPMLLAMLFLR